MRQITVMIKNIPADLDAKIIGETANHFAMQGWNMNAGKITIDLDPDANKKTHR